MRIAPFLKQDEVYDELVEVWAQRVRTKKYTREACCFERDAGRYLMEQAEQVAQGTWKPSGYNSFKVYRPERIISAPRYADRITQYWFVDRYIKPWISPQLHPENMACQQGKGSKKAMAVLRNALSDMVQKHETGFWFLQYDMQGYYDNLSQERLLKMFHPETLAETRMHYAKQSGNGDRIPFSEYKDYACNAYPLFSNLIHSWNCPDAYAAREPGASGRYGIPKGTLPSQWMGIYYLNDLDHMISGDEDAESSIRYMDDGIVLMKDKASCIRMKKKIEGYLRENQLGIRLHPKKTRYAPISSGINFCGWRYTVKPSGKIIVRIKQSKKKEQYQKIKHLQYAYAKGQISWLEVKDTMRGILKYQSWGDTYRLRKYICSRFAFTRECPLDEVLEKERSSAMPECINPSLEDGGKVFSAASYADGIDEMQKHTQNFQLWGWEGQIESLAPPVFRK